MARIRPLMKQATEHALFGSRLTGAVIVVSVTFSLLVARLWYLQSLRGAHFRDLSENNRTRTVRTVAPRGTIFDREGRILVRNRPAFDVALLLEDVPDLEKALRDIAAIVGKDVSELREALGKQRGRQPFEPKVVLADVSPEELAKIQVNRYRLPGTIVSVAPKREYPHGAFASQVLGYVREISKSQLDAPGGAEYRSGDLVGQAGLEKRWEPRLKGRGGVVRVEVDAMGNRRGELGIVDSSPGDDLVLTIDLDLQQAAEEAIRELRAAVVAIDPRNGEILALASSPAVDGNLFSRGITAKEWQRVTHDKWHPLTNRVIAENYPPGSTFKLVVAVAALAEQVVSEHTKFDCPGYYLFAGRRFHCHKRSGHGKVDLRKAIRVSCNAYFYQLGQLLGVDGIERYASLFGLGRRTGIGLPGEREGIVPSREWKLKFHGERWYPGDTIPVSIGQGYLAVTPLQMALTTAALANGGTVFRPMLIKKVVRERTGLEEEFSAEMVRDITVPHRAIERVREFSMDVVHHERGTAQRAKIEGVTIGGKTGTAQVSGLGRSNNNPDLEDHAWFIAFAPVEKPELAVAVIVEHGGHGGVTAAPIARAVFERYFVKKGVVEPPLEETTLVQEHSAENQARG